jgi:Leucine-rich repeat (LRR) protein/sugar lactone lactonase YvrE
MLSKSRPPNAHHFRWAKRFYPCLHAILVVIAFSAHADTDCTAVTEIPTAQCETLIDLYNSTDGDNWTANDNWLQNNTPCNWRGITCSGGGVTEIDLNGKGLNGPLPDISALTDLTLVKLYNNALTGPIPDLSALTQLSYLHLYNNDFTGTIPELKTLTQLKNLYLGKNQLTGPVPDFTGLTNLQYIHLQENELTGEMPDFRDNTNLRELRLDYNQLTGTIPALTHLTNLQQLRVQANQFTGEIPDLTGLTNLWYLAMSSNQLTGTIPAYFNQLTNLKDLYLHYNQLTGTIPDLSKLTNLRNLYLYENQLTGTIPDEISTLTNLRALTLNNNQFTGTIPDLSQLTGLSYLWLGYNQLTGPVPSFTTLTNLKEVLLQGNQLTGSIPDLSSLGLVQKLGLHGNKLTGTIPDLSALEKAWYIALSGNQLTGTIPDLSKLARVSELYLHTNQLSGSIPDLSQLANLRYLQLYNNQLSGSIPDLSQLTNLKILYLQNNQLSGSIPDLSALTHLQKLALHTNKLTGEIPDVSQLGNVWYFSVSYNKLSGPIPDLTGLTKLSELYLHDNVLTGTIPDVSVLPNATRLWFANNLLTGSLPELNSLTKLRVLRTQNNNLSGAIPDTSALVNLQEFYIYGNPQLCKDADINYTGRSEVDNIALCPGAEVNLVASTNASACVGQNMAITVTKQRPQTVDGIQIGLTFDPATLKVNSLTGSGVLDTLKNEFDNEAGTVQFAAGNFFSEPVGNDFELVTINVTPLAASSGTPVSFNTEQTVATYNRNDLASDTENLTLAIEYCPESPVTFRCDNVEGITSAQCEVLVALYDNTDGNNWTNNAGWKRTNTPCDWQGLTCDNGEITAIELTDNNLNGSLPDLGTLSNLQTVALTSNQLCKTPNTDYSQWSALDDVLSCDDPSYGLVLHLPFDGNADDASGNNNDGIVNGATLTTDRHGSVDSAYAFDGQTYRIKLPHSSLNELDTFSMGFWAQTADIGTSKHLVTSANSGQHNEFLIRHDAGKIVLLIKGIEHAFDTPKINDGEWHSVNVVRSSSTVEVFVDGSLAATWQYAPAGQLAVDLSGFWLGGDQDCLGGCWDKNQQFSGIMDEVSLHNRALTASEIQSYYDSTKPATTGCNGDIQLADNLCEGLTLYMPMDGNANDESGNGSNGEVNGATLTTDRHGNANSAYEFDGQSHYISIADSPQVDFAQSQDFAVAFWVKPDDIQPYTQYGDNDIIEKWSSGRNADGREVSYPYVFRYLNQTHKNHGKIVVARYDGDKNPGFGSTVKINDDQFHHVVFVKKGDQLQLFVDGSLNATVTDTTVSNTTNDSPLFLGRRGHDAAPNYFKGVIDDLLIYNRALSASEIQSYYDSTKPATTGCNGDIQLADNLCEGLVAYYPLDDTPNDASGNGNDGTVNGATLTTDRHGNADSAYYFNGNGHGTDSIQIPHTVISGLTDVTTSVWIQTNDQEQGILSGANTDQQNHYLLYMIRGKIQAHIKQDDSFLTSPIINDGQWHQIVFVRDGSSGLAQIFIDGKSVGSKTLPAGALSISPNGLWIGRDQDCVGGCFQDYQDFLGSIDEITIHNRALSASEIQSYYNSSKPATTGCNGELQLADNLCEGLVAYYPLDDNANDASGNGNDGTEHTVNYATGVVGQAAKLDTTGYIRKENFNFTAEDITVALWAYADKLPDNTWGRALFALHSGGYGTGQGDKGVKMGLIPSGEIHPTLITEDGQTGIGRPVGTMGPKKWHHLAFVRDSGGLQKLYVDGVRVGAVVEKSILDAQLVLQNGLLEIGAPSYYEGGWEHVSRNQKWEGLLDEMYVYNRELTDTEVQALYNAGGLATPPQTGCNDDTQRPDNLCDGLIAFYPLDGNANEVSGNADNGTVDNATLTTDRFGNANSAYSFDGSSSQITVPNIDGLRNYSQFAVAAWIKNQGGGHIIRQGVNCPDGAPVYKGNSFSFGIDSNDKVGLSVNSGTGNFYEAGNQIIGRKIVAQDDNWHFVVGTFDNGELSLYIDGVKDTAKSIYFDDGKYVNNMKPSAQSSQFSLMADSSEELTIGVKYSWCGHTFKATSFKGAIDDVQMYNRVLTDAEIQALYNAANPVASETVLEDGEDGSTGGWQTFEERSGGAAFENVFDSEINSRVIEFTGDSRSGYSLTKPDGSAFSNTTDFIAQWRIKTAPNTELGRHTFTWGVKTSDSVITISYHTGGIRDCRRWGTKNRNQYVSCGLDGSRIRDGKWHTITRDLEADLKAADSSLELQEVRGVSTRTAGRVDDIQLLNRDAVNFYTISGTITDENGQGMSDTPIMGATCQPSDSQGNFECTVPEGWVGGLTISTQSDDRFFAPVTRSYSDVSENITEQNFTAKPIRDGLLGHWTFDDCDAKDNSGNDIHGVIYGAPKCVDGIQGKGLSFNGIDESITVDGHIHFAGQNITTTAWVYIEEATKGSVVFKYDWLHANGINYSMGTGGLGKYANTIGMRTESAKDDEDIGKSYPRTENEQGWVHLAMVLTPESQKLYANGELKEEVITLPEGFEAYTGPRPLEIAGVRHNSDHEFFNSVMDEVRLYNRALSASEIQALYNAANPVASETVLEDAEDGNTENWSVFAKRPTNFTISNVFDSDRNSQVIEFKGEKYLDVAYWGYSRYGVNNTTDFIAQWSMKTATPEDKHAFFWHIQTSGDTLQTIVYVTNAVSTGCYKSNKQLLCSLDSSVQDGNWHTITRDLEADLKTVVPDIELQEVKFVEVRTAGRVDDIKLLNRNAINFRTISGTITENGQGLSGVSFTISGADCQTSDNHGDFQCTVPEGWFGTLVPEKSGYTFEPLTRVYKELAEDSTNQTFTAQTAPEKTDGFVLEDAENGLADGWWTFSPKDGGALYHNVFDTESNSRVIEFRGDPTSGYRLNRPELSSPGNTYLTAQWRMKTATADGSYAVYWQLKTSGNVSYIVYSSDAPSGCHLNDYFVRCGLEGNLQDGEWHTITRDLAADVKAAKPDIEIQEIEYFQIRMAGQIDDIQLLESETAQVKLIAEANTTQACIGQNLTIMINKQLAQTVNEIQMALSYDANLFKVNSITNAGPLAQFNANFANGTAQIEAGNFTGVGDEFAIATLQLTPLATSVGTTVQFNDSQTAVKLNGAPLRHESQGTTLAIKDCVSEVIIQPEAHSAIWTLVEETQAIEQTGENLDAPKSISFDASGNAYIADSLNHRILKRDTQGNLSVVAGTGKRGKTGDDGPAIEAKLNNPQGIAVDEEGNLYIADTNNHRIRKVDSNGIITTIAGIGKGGYAGDNGLATAAKLKKPTAIVFDNNGHLYITDSGNHRIRKVSGQRTRKPSANSLITTVAGDGRSGYRGDNGPATGARLNNPTGLAVDNQNNLYIADTDNHRIRKVDLTGTITTVAGNGIKGYSGDGDPATAAQINAPTGLEVDSTGNLYIADRNNHRIRKVDNEGIITTFTGTGKRGTATDGILAEVAQINQPSDVALDQYGNLYIADKGNDTIRKIGEKDGEADIAEAPPHQIADCPNTEVTGIPENECYALVALYDSTKGPEWTNNDGWKATDTPCQWKGVTCQDGHVTAIDLPNNNLVGDVPPQIGALINLQELNLNDNQISGAIPTTIEHLNNLETLNLANNALTGSLPMELGDATSLQTVNLANNQISGAIPDLNALTKLQTLNLSENLLNGPVPDLTDLPALQTLDISGDDQQVCQDSDTDYGNLPVGNLDECPTDNQLPIAAFTATPNKGEAPLTVNLDARSSYDPYGNITVYVWETSDAQILMDATPTITFQKSGTYEIRLRVLDHDGAPSINVATRLIEVSPGPDQVTLNLDKDGMGLGTVYIRRDKESALTCNAKCQAESEDYPQGSEIKLTARAVEGSLFTGWRGDCVGTEENNRIQITMDSPKHCTAVFELEQNPPSTMHALTIDSVATMGSGGTIEVKDIVCHEPPCKSYHPAEQQVKITGTPSPHAYFIGWNLDCPVLGEYTDATNLVVLTKDTTCIAYFGNDSDIGAVDTAKEFEQEAELYTGESVTEIYPPADNRERYEQAFRVAEKAMMTVEDQMLLDGNSWPDHFNDIKNWFDPLPDNLYVETVQIKSGENVFDDGALIIGDYVHVEVSLLSKFGDEELVSILVYYDEKPTVEYPTANTRRRKGSRGYACWRRR